MRYNLLKVIACIICICSFVLTKAQTTKNIPNYSSKLKEATVYYGAGAELTHHAEIAVTKGLQEIIINDISITLDAASVQIAVPEGVALMSSRVQHVYDNKKPIEAVGVAPKLDSIKQIRFSIDALQSSISIKEEQLAKTSQLILPNAQLAPGKEINSTELLKLIDYYTTKIETIKVAIYQMQVQKTQHQSRIDSIQQRINDIHAEVYKYNTTSSAPKCQLVLQVYAQQAIQNGLLKVSYFTRNAGWSPSYDYRVKSKDNSSTIVYKAQLQQSTGIDWKQVLLTLSTTSPNTQQIAPELTPWRLQLLEQQYRSGITTLNNNVALQEVVVVGYGKSRADIDDVESDMRKQTTKASTSYVDPSTLKSFTAQIENQLNVNFNISIPYDIPSNGNTYNVNIKEEDIKATYSNVSIPRKDVDAYMISYINDWESLNLLSGKVNIVLDNVYIGQTFINPVTIADTLMITLGRDKRLAVNRKLIKDLSKQKVRGDNREEQYTYEITIKNNKSTEVTTQLKDQYPIAINKEIEIKLTDSGDAQVNEETGFLQWNIKLAPGESKKVRFSYTIRYPRNRQLMQSK
ncbi:MAG TPA: hypothetical protein DCQ29_06035 [Chitinophagaceae bacterium]|nr:hypothetical protein [Chitinophagaceae bacterium]